MASRAISSGAGDSLPRGRAYFDKSWMLSDIEIAQ
jgi:hypothetical protein